MLQNVDPSKRRIVSDRQLSGNNVTPIITTATTQKLVEGDSREMSLEVCREVVSRLAGRGM
jgi:hypothetical protein